LVKNLFLRPCHRISLVLFRCVRLIVRLNLLLAPRHRNQRLLQLFSPPDDRIRSIIPHDQPRRPRNEGRELMPEAAGQGGDVGEDLHAQARAQRDEGRAARGRVAEQNVDRRRVDRQRDLFGVSFRTAEGEEDGPAR
jgi:hypothetical protein